MKMPSIKFSIFLITVFAIILLWPLNMTSTNLYPLSGSYYLKKIDYFSHYSLIKKGDVGDEEVLEKVSEIYQEPTGWWILGESEKSIAIDTKSNSHFDTNSNPGGKKISPWSIVESTTLNSSPRILRQLLQMLIVFLLANIALLLVKKYAGNSKEKLANKRQNQ